MPDENRVFDISKPGSTNAHPAGKPVIVGHHPAASDPMMKMDSSSSEAPPTHILVQDSNHHSDHSDIDKPASHDDAVRTTFAPVAPASHPVLPEPIHSSFGEESSPHQDADHNQPPADHEDHVDTSADSADPDGDNPDKGAPNNYSSTTDPQMPEGHLGHVEGIHLPPRKHGRKGAKVLMIVILLAVAGYLFIDSNVVNTGINLPFHIFKQKTNTADVTASPPPAATPPAAPAATVPDGFSQYKITGTTVNFAAPTAWGKPTSTTDKGFTARSSDAQPDSSYAYLVDFPSNKDVEMAVTSSKYLPPARTALYYDFLQWCTGSSDGKYYLSVLKFTTADKVDTPSTVSCDQGPLANPTKLDDTTIVQTGLKDASGNLIGDIYTKNLTDKDLPVLRVKDAASKNSDDIKKLLNTVKEQS